ncbi:Rabenosyn-5 [Toxocara canis]|uniref:Rabenosyn-5 n=1 Tax=Toxocara canis TaxID=6265 RepID=A0A0B2V8S9_TOXCA|nr:Rabenosyn-5 [Toxocara canis]
MSEIFSMEAGSSETIEEIIRQGFLCPFCLQDLGDTSHLHAHVGRYHPESASSVYAFDHLKGFFDKAKQKIMQIDTPFSNFDLPVLVASSSSAVSEVRTTEKDVLARRRSPRRFFDEAQGIGCSRSHTEYFLKCRAPCINEAAMHTNNLIIRLDKLINQCPADVTKRKAFERETVPWVADGDSNMCRVCNVKFTLTRRRHHCRLCGKIMCHSCSQFLSFITARRLTNPAFAAQMMEEISRVEAKDSVLGGYTADSSPSKSPWVADAIRQAVSGDSLQSMRKKSEKLFSSTLALVKGDGTEDEDEHLRICAVCKNLLDIRDEKMEQMSAPPMIVVLYERLCSIIREAEKLTSSYARMHDSLSKGESMYTLESAAQLRNKLVHLQREIDSLSAKIEALGLDEESVRKTSPRERILQKNIRFLALRTLQVIMSQLNALPKEDEYKQLQEKRRAEIARQTELERERNAFTVKPSSSNASLKEFVRAASEEDSPRRTRLKGSASFTSIGPTPTFTDGGWTPSTNSAYHHNPFMDDEHELDPLQQQIFIIKGYLKEAAEDGRLDEVEILEENLRDLENELKLHTADAAVDR